MSTPTPAAKSDNTKKHSKPMQLVAENVSNDEPMTSISSPHSNNSTTTNDLPTASWNKNKRSPFDASYTDGYNASPSLPASSRFVPIEFLYWKAGFIVALNLASQILAARLILLVAVLGAIALAWISLPTLDWAKVVLLAIYCCGVLGPLVWFSSKA